MFGIMGYIGSKDVVPVLIDGLRRLEYRGYDSAGIGLVSEDGIQIRRRAGKLSQLDAVLDQQPITGQYGIGHTRWATHGRPTDENAHPHRDCTGRVLVVHNGIIENYLTLKEELQAQGHTFRTQTDTEIVAHLIERELCSAKASAERAGASAERAGFSRRPPRADADARPVRPRHHLRRRPDKIVAMQRPADCRRRGW